jgi:hypothetical protein
MLMPASQHPFFRRGGQFQTGGGSATIVTSGANLSGILVKTFYIFAAAGGSVTIDAGGNNLFFSGNGQITNWAGALFIPAGQALNITGSGTISWSVSWDLIP